MRGWDAESMLSLSSCFCSLEGEDDSLLGTEPIPELSIESSLETGVRGLSVDLLLPLLLLSSSMSSPARCGMGPSPKLLMPKLLSFMEAVGVCPASSWRSEAMKNVVGVLLVDVGLLLDSGSAKLRFRGDAPTALLPVAGRIMGGDRCFEVPTQGDDSFTVS